jgi:N-acyl-D-amino-acid deacylase
MDVYFNTRSYLNFRPGFATDLVLFDPATVTDRSTYDAGRTPAEGVAHALVSGTRVLEDGAPTGATPGRALHRG